jgi:ferric-dicitrate binding protein FerR (iron transport regulator)
MSAARRLQLVQLVAVADAGLVRVAWSAAWSCYLVTVTRPRLGVVAEHIERDRARALDLADQALAELAELAGMPA